ncbi:MAG: TusE/DsrC/DsvC family sulfur relay protein [Sandaracinaceae bacterium]|nr:TusE/DsrC/DsvC family sulfur relay protein [Sandaracinaceae bacterium]
METKNVHVPGPEGKTQDHSLAALHARLDQLSADVTYLVERQRKIDDFLDDFGPIAKAMLNSTASRLDGYEKRGYFEMGREALGIVERVAEGFTPDDVRKLGGAVVGILETVRELTQPEVLKVASEAASVLQNAEEAAPIGIVGMVRATSDHDVQKGMSVMVEVMRQVGRAAAAVRDKRAASPMGQKKAKLDAVLGRRMGTQKSALGVERTLPPRPREAASKIAAPASKGPACATPAAPAATATVLDGVGFSADGHMTDASQWTRELGQKIATMQAVDMTDAHWKLVEVARKDFESTKTSPNIRRLTQITDVTTKDVYALFPKAPARTLAKIAGLPKPAGCL